MTPCKYDWRGLYQLDMARGRLKMNVADFSHHRPDTAWTRGIHSSALPSQKFRRPDESHQVV